MGFSHMIMVAIAHFCTNPYGHPSTTAQDVSTIGRNVKWNLMIYVDEKEKIILHFGVIIDTI